MAVFVLKCKRKDSAPLRGGIIAQLTTECEYANLHEEGIVEVTASSLLFSSLCPVRNVVELWNTPWFGSKNEPNSWICYNFKERRVAPTGYSIRTAERSYPKSWVLEVSNDGSEGSWQVVDRRENNEDLNGKNVVHKFEISAPPSGGFRFIHLRLTGKNHDGNDRLDLSGLEVFGTISSQ